MRSKLATAVFFSALMAACSGGEPNEDVTKQAFIDGVGGESKVNVLSFEKTNGQTADHNGVKIYTSFFKAKVIWPHGLNTNCMNRQYATFHGECWTLQPSDMAAPGTQQELQSQVQFQQTEKGWMTPSGKVY